MKNTSNDQTENHPNWIVCRQDDNGNVFEVQRRLTEEDARQLAADLESHGHKQLYWVTQEDLRESDEFIQK